MKTSLLKRIYYWFHKKTSNPEERDEYSSGHWQDAVRKEALRRSVQRSGKLLEVGCGEGLFLSALALHQKPLALYGVDINKTLLDRAQERFTERGITGIELSLADGASLPYEDASFDIVACINVIFNLPSRDTVRTILREIARVGKEGSSLLLDFRNAKNPLLYLKYKLAPYYDQTVKDLPLKTYTMEDMQVLLSEAGFTTVDAVSVGFWHKQLAPIILLEVRKEITKKEDTIV